MHSFPSPSLGKNVNKSEKSFEDDTAEAKLVD